MKRTFVSILLLICIAPLTFVAQAESGTSPTLAIVGGQLIDGYGGEPLADAVVLIADNKIVKVGRESKVDIPADVRTVDVNGMTIMPGLWESHGHLFHLGEGDPASFPDKFGDQAKSVMASVAEVSLMSGITSFRDTGGPIAPQQALKADIEAGELPGPRLFLAGPILNQGEPRPGQSDDYLIGSVQEARKVTREVIDLGVDQVKVYGFWDLDILSEVVDTAHEAGLGVDADVRHLRAYKTAIEAGVDRLHHVFTADPLSGYSVEDIRFLVRGVGATATGPMANILRGPFIIPTIEMRNAYVRTFNFPELVDHPRFKKQYSEEIYNHLRSTWQHPTSIPWGIGAPERVKVAKRKLAEFISAGGREQIVAGTDAGSPFNLHSPLTRELAHYGPAGLTPMEVIQSATLRAAQMQGVEDELGTVTAGKYADIIIVDGDPLQDITLLQHKVVLVVKDGQVFQPDHNPAF